MIFQILVISSLIVFTIQLLYKQYKQINDLQNTVNVYLDELERSKDKGIKPLDGIFEIHITVDPFTLGKNNFVSLLSFVKLHEKDKGMKVVFAVSDKGNNQYMLSYFTRKTNEKDAIDSANHISDSLKEFGIKVIRVKVESHNTKGTPMTRGEYKRFSEYLFETYKASTPYFEFHVKISGHNIDLNYIQLEKDIIQFKYTAISHNLCSKNRKPLLTIRVYNEGFIGAQKYKDCVLDKMKEMGYVFEDIIQQEFSVWDTNTDLDHDWIE